MILWNSKKNICNDYESNKCSECEFYYSMESSPFIHAYCCEMWVEYCIAARFLRIYVCLFALLIRFSPTFFSPSFRSLAVFVLYLLDLIWRWNEHKNMSSAHCAPFKIVLFCRSRRQNSNPFFCCFSETNFQISSSNELFVCKCFHRDIISVNILMNIEEEEKTRRKGEKEKKERMKLMLKMVDTLVYRSRNRLSMEKTHRSQTDKIWQFLLNINIQLDLWPNNTKTNIRIVYAAIRCT